MPAKANSGWILASLVTLVVVGYGNVLYNPFVYDDLLTVVHNPSLHSLFSWEVLTYERFRPLVNLSYAIDRAVWGVGPLGFHVTSVSLHALNVLLVFFVARALFADLAVEMSRAHRLAWASAAIFACHPLLTEAVGYISARSELLCASLMLSSFLCFRRRLRGDSARWQVFGTFLWLGALGAKEVGAMLPPMLFLYDRLILTPPPKQKLRWLVYSPLFLLLCIGGAARLWLFLNQESHLRLPIAASLVQQSLVLFSYLGLWLRPWGLSLIHPVEEVTTVWNPLALVFLAWVVLLGVLWAVRRRFPTLLLGVGWFLLCLLPSTLAPLNEPMAEHRVYCASVGIVLAAAGLFLRPFRWAKSLPGWAPAMGMAALLIVLLSLTVRRNRVWSSESKLWGDAAHHAPRVWAARYAYGDALRQEGRLDEAIREYQAAAELRPQEPRAFNNLGICLAQIGRLDQAAQALRRSLQIDPNQGSAQRNLARLEQLRANAGQLPRDVPPSR